MDYILTLLDYLRVIFITGLLGLIIYYLIHIGNRFVLEEERFKITRKYVVYFILSVLGILILYYIFKNSGLMSNLIMPTIYSIAFAYLLNPLVNLLEEKGIKRLWGVLIIYLVAIGAIVIMSLIIFPTISVEFQKLIKNLPKYFEELGLLFDNLNEIYLQYSRNLQSLPAEFQNIQNVIADNLNSVQQAIIISLQNFTNSIIGMFSKIFGLFIIPILTFYFLKDKEYFKKKIVMSIPKKFRTDTIKISREIDSAIGKFIRGQMLVALFVAIATIIGLLILGVDFAFIIGIFVGIANFIPFFGPIIGTVPAVFFAILEEPIKALWVIILFVIIQQVESNILAPKIVGESVGLHPVVVIVALLVGASFGGILGMLLAVPVAAIIKIISAFTIEKLTNI